MIASVAEAYELGEAAEIAHVSRVVVFAEPVEVVEFLGSVELAAPGKLIQVAKKRMSSMGSLRSLGSLTSLTLRSSPELCYPCGESRTHQRQTTCLPICHNVFIHRQRF